MIFLYFLFISLEPLSANNVNNFKILFENTIDLFHYLDDYKKLIGKQLTNNYTILDEMSSLIDSERCNFQKKMNKFDLNTFLYALNGILEIPLLKPKETNKRISMYKLFYKQLAKRSKPKNFKQWYCLFDDKNDINSNHCFKCWPALNYQLFIKKRLSNINQKRLKLFLLRIFNFLLNKAAFLENIIQILYEFDEITFVSRSKRFDRTSIVKSRFRTSKIQYCVTIFPIAIDIQSESIRLYNVCLSLKNMFYGMAGIFIFDKDEYAFNEAFELFSCNQRLMPFKKALN